MGLVSKAHENRIPASTKSQTAPRYFVDNRQAHVPQQKNAIKIVSVRINEEDTIRLAQPAAIIERAAEQPVRYKTGQVFDFSQRNSVGNWRHFAPFEIARL